MVAPAREVVPIRRKGLRVWSGASRSQQVAAGPLLAAACGLLVGCGLPGTFSAAVPHSVALTDRCADIVKMAFPSADIDIAVEKRTSQITGLDTVVVRVEGIRKDLPEDGKLARDLAAECHFDDSILTGFRWTKGPRG